MTVEQMHPGEKHDQSGYVPTAIHVLLWGRVVLKGLTAVGCRCVAYTAKKYSALERAAIALWSARRHGNSSLEHTAIKTTTLFVAH